MMVSLGRSSWADSVCMASSSGYRPTSWMKLCRMPRASSEIFPPPVRDLMLPPRLPSSSVSAGEAVEGWRGGNRGPVVGCCCCRGCWDNRGCEGCWRDSEGWCCCDWAGWVCSGRRRGRERRQGCYQWTLICTLIRPFIKINWAVRKNGSAVFRTGTRWRNFPCNISFNVISSADRILFFLFLVVGDCVSHCGGRGNRNAQVELHTRTQMTQSELHAVGIHWETGLSIIASAAYQALLPGSDKQAPCAQFTLRWSGWFAAVWECYRWLSLCRQNPVSVNTWHITCKMSHCVVREVVSGQLVVPIDPAKWVLFYFHFWVRHCRIDVS